MSYHILHQFDEQWFGDSSQNEASRSNNFLGSRRKRQNDRANSCTAASQRPWIITIMAVIVAACALYFAMDAHRQTIELQQRISELEARLKK